MPIVNTITLFLLIVGGLNWGIFAIANTDLIGSLLSPGSGLAKIIYLLVAVSAVWQLIPLFRTINSNEVSAQRDVPLR